MDLKKPDPNKPVFELMPEILDLINAGRCPDCKKTILKNGSGRLWFRDQLSREEYGISGLCQKCQDITYGREVS